MIPNVDRASEVAAELQGLRTQMVAHKVDKVVLNHLINLVWLTAGTHTLINLASDTVQPRCSSHWAMPMSLRTVSRIAYLPREILALPNEPSVIAEHQAFAWNPSIRGANSEDTMLLGPAGPRILTHTPGWPIVSFLSTTRLFCSRLFSNGQLKEIAYEGIRGSTKA